MNTIVGIGWELSYVIEKGKCIGMKYTGKAKYMKVALSRLEQELKNYAAA